MSRLLEAALPEEEIPFQVASRERKDGGECFCGCGFTYGGKV